MREASQHLGDEILACGTFEELLDKERQECCLRAVRTGENVVGMKITQVDKDGSGDISKAEFEDACAKGLVKNIEN
jgi:hypothetical protein